MDNSAINIVTDQELNLDNMTLRERREIISAKLEDNDAATLIHTRWIDAKMYQVISTVQDGAVNNDVKTELSLNEVLEFEQTWTNHWHPQLSDENTQMPEQDCLNSFECTNKNSDTGKEEPQLNEPLAESEPTTTIEYCDKESQLEVRYSGQSKEHGDEASQTGSNLETAEQEDSDSVDNTFNLGDIKKTIVTEQKQVVDGVTMKDRREFTDPDTEGNSILVHTRSINDCLFQATVTLQDGIELTRQVQTDMTDEEAKIFENNWNEKWVSQSESKTA